MSAAQRTPAGGHPAQGRVGGPGSLGTSQPESATSTSTTATAELQPPAPEPKRILLADLPRDPTTRTERDALMAVLQEPGAVGSERIAQLADVRFTSDALAAVRDAIVATVDRSARPDWVLLVADEAPAAVSVLARELAFATMPVSASQPASIYATGIVKSLLERDLLRRKAELVGRLQRTDAVHDPTAYRVIQQDLTRIETERRALRDD